MVSIVQGCNFGSEEILSYTPNIIRMIRSRKMGRGLEGRVWHVWGEERCAWDKEQIRILEIDGMVITKWVNDPIGTGQYLSGSGYWQTADFCEYSNEPSGSIKCWQLLEYLKTSASQDGFCSMESWGKIIISDTCLKATQCYGARGDIWNEKTFCNISICKIEVQHRRNFQKFRGCLFMDTYITLPVSFVNVF